MNDKDTQFSSKWDIRKTLLGETKNITITGGGFPPTNYLVKDFASLGLTKPPMVLMRIKNQGSNLWFTPGGGLYFSGFTAGPLVDFSVTNTKLYVSSFKSGTQNITVDYYLLTGSANSV